jgi:hypothetical protein
MERLSRKNGWFVPVGKLLDYLHSQRGDHVLSETERSLIETKWLMAKVFHGTS